MTGSYSTGNTNNNYHNHDISHSLSVSLIRLSLHGASLATLLHKAQGHSNTLLVVQDSRGAIFGALVTDSMKVAERDKYYGNGTMGVWSFNNPNGALRYYNWSFKNSYFMITSKECIAFGGGGHFALYLVRQLASFSLYSLLTVTSSLSLCRTRI